MKKTYKLHLRKNSTYYMAIVGRMCEVLDDLWTTIVIELPEGQDDISDALVIYYGKANLMKQVAKYEWGNIRLWKKVQLDNADIEVVRV